MRKYPFALALLLVLYISGCVSSDQVTNYDNTIDEKSFDWKSASVENFIDYEKTPYVTSAHMVGGLGSLGKFADVDSKAVSSSPFEASGEMPDVVGYVIIGDLNDASMTFSNLKRDIAEVSKIVTKLEVGGEEVYSAVRDYSGELSYTWTEDRFIFHFTGKDPDKILEIVKEIIGKYSDEKPTKIETLGISYSCGDGRCEDLENSQNCCRDCGCGEGYECGLANECVEEGKDCSKAGFIIQKGAYADGSLEINIFNTGDIVLEDFVFNVKYLDGSISEQKREFPVESKSIRTFTISVEDDFQRISVISGECPSQEDYIDRDSVHGIWT